MIKKSPDRYLNERKASIERGDMQRSVERGAKTRQVHSARTALHAKEKAETVRITKNAHVRRDGPAEHRLKQTKIRQSRTQQVATERKRSDDQNPESWQRVQAKSQRQAHAICGWLHRRGTE